MTKLSETLSRLAEIKARAEKATPGPWEVEGPETETYRPGGKCDGIRTLANPSQCLGRDREYFPSIVVADSGVYPPCLLDAEFIVSARTDVPDMADALEEARALLERLEWSGLDMSSDPDSTMGPWACCPFCHAPEGNRHGPNCKLAAALGR